MTQQRGDSYQIARAIQQGLLPQGSPQLPGFDIAGFCQPAEETGGDTYDFMPLSDGRLMVVVADATGHGIGAALVIAQTRAILRTGCLQGRDLNTIMATANDLLLQDLGNSRFVTCFLGVLDPQHDLLTFVSAGHGPILVYHRDQDSFDKLSATAVPLAIMEESVFTGEITRTFGPGDFILIATDGFFEATDADREPFGIWRMMDLLRRDRDLSPREMIDNLYSALGQYTGRTTQIDDVTAVVIRKL